MEHFHFIAGKLTISMAIFHSHVINYQRANLHFPMVFFRFSYGFATLFGEKGTSTAMASPPRREDPCSSRRTMPLGGTVEPGKLRGGVLEITGNRFF